MDIQVHSSLSQDSINQINDFRALAPNFDTKIPTKQSIESHLDKYCSQSDIFSWVLAKNESDALIGHLALFSRIIHIDNQSIKLGGIGKVRVHQQYRRQGIASKLISQAMIQLNQQNCDIAYLCTTPKLYPLYQQFGFKVLDHKYEYIGKSGKHYQESDGMIADLKGLPIYNHILTGKITLNLGVGNW